METNTDFYGSLAELDRHLVRDRDYRMLLCDRASPITIIAPHGGYIERGTSYIAKAIAGPEHNLFDFQGLRRRRAWELHITSVRFRQPQLVDMLARSCIAVSIHSMGTEDDGTILIGGLNCFYRDRVFSELQAQGFPVTTSGRRYRGVHPQNIVNLAQEQGVQIELTEKVIARMFRRRSALFSPADQTLNTTAYFERFVQAVRRAIDRNFKSGDRMINQEISTAPDGVLLAKIAALFKQCQEGETGGHSLRDGRKLERRLGKLVVEVAALAPGSAAHADALAYHQYTLLSLSRCSKHKDTTLALRHRAYRLGAESVTIGLKSTRPSLNTVFAAYNLGIDLVITERRSQEGLEWLLASRRLMEKLYGRHKLSTRLLHFKLFVLGSAIARAYYDLGQPARAARILRLSLAQAPQLSTASWSSLRGVASCAALLAQIELDILEGKVTADSKLS